MAIAQHDELLSLLDGLGAARSALAEQLQTLERAIETARDHLGTEEGVAGVLRTLSIEARGSVMNAMNDLSKRLAVSRTEVVRTLVDDEGWSLSQIARETGTSRQLIGRLYAEARGRRSKP